MTSTAIDALRAARDLEAAEIERKQAEVFAGALRQAAAVDCGELATKTGLADLRVGLAAVGGRISRAPWIHGDVIVAILAKSKLFVGCLPENSYSIEIEHIFIVTTASSCLVFQFHSWSCFGLREPQTGRS